MQVRSSLPSQTAANTFNAGEQAASNGTKPASFAKVLGAAMGPGESSRSITETEPRISSKRGNSSSSTEQPEKATNKDQAPQLTFDLGFQPVPSVLPPRQFGALAVLPEEAGSSGKQDEPVDGTGKKNDEQNAPDRAVLSGLAPIAPGTQPAATLLAGASGPSNPAQNTHQPFANVLDLTDLKANPTVPAGQGEPAAAHEVAFAMQLAHSAEPAATGLQAKVTAVKAEPPSPALAVAKPTEPTLAAPVLPADPSTGANSQHGDSARDEKRPPAESEKPVVAKDALPDTPVPNLPKHDFAANLPLGGSLQPAVSQSTAREQRTAPPDMAAALARPEVAETRTESTHGAPLREIALRMSGTADDAVDLHIIDNGGKLHVEVRTGDSQLAASLRENVGDLVQKLDHSGYRTESLSNHAGPLNESQAANDGGRKSGADQEQSGGQGGGQPRHQQQQHGQGRGNRPQWLEEIVRNFQSTVQQQENEQ